MGNYLKFYNVVENNNCVLYYIKFKKKFKYWIVFYKNFIIFESDNFINLSIDILEMCLFICYVCYFVILGYI